MKFGANKNNSVTVIKLLISRYKIVTSKKR